MTSILSAPAHKFGTFRRSSIGLGALVVFIIGVHLRLSIYSGGSALIPQFICLTAGAMLAALYQKQLLKTVPSMLALSVTLLVSPILNYLFLSSTNFLEIYKSSLQLLISMKLMLALVAFLTTIEPLRLAKLATRLWIFFIILALLELFGMRGFFDAIGDELYSASGRGVYKALDRDQLIYGQIRPKAMATEPSFLATTLLCLCTLSTLSGRSSGKPNVIRNGVFMLIISYLVCPSMIIVFFAAAIAIWLYWPKTRRGRAMIAFLLVGTLTLTLFAQSHITQIATLSNLVLGGHTATGSFFGRIAVAPSVGIEVLQHFPLLGVGVGNGEAARPIIDSNWLNKGAFSMFPWFADPTLQANDLMSNGFWWQWIYLGAAGGLLFLALTISLLRNVGVALPFRAVICAWIIWYAGGAFVDPVSWFMVALFCIPPPSDENTPSTSFNADDRILAPGDSNGQ